MNKKALKNIIKACITEIREEFNQNDSVHVSGYGVVKVEWLKKRIIEDLTKTLEHAKKNDWSAVNHFVGERGNGVLPSFATALRNYFEKKKGVVSYNDVGGIKDITK